MNRLFRLSFPLVLLASALAVGCGAPQAPPGKMQMPPPKVEVCTPIEQQVTDYEDFPGRIEAVNAVDIRARVTGYLLEAKFAEGTDVKQGDVLFEIDPRPYLAQLNQDQADLANKKAMVTKTEALLRRSLSLAGKVASSQEDIDNQKGDFEVAKAAVLQAEAKIQTSQLNLDWTKVTAPLSGRISRRYVDPGNLVKADDTVLTSIVSLDPVYAYFDIDERTTIRLQRLVREGVIQWSPGKSLPVLLGLPDEEGYPRYGEINFADNRLDSDTGTWRLRARFDNPDLALTPGMYVRMRANIGAPYRALLVPEKALGTDQGVKIVYVVTDAGTVQSRPVKEGKVYDGMRVIREGIKPGDKVVVTGLQRIRKDAPVDATLISPDKLVKGKPPAKPTEVKEANDTKQTKEARAQPETANAKPRGDPHPGKPQGKPHEERIGVAEGK